MTRRNVQENATGVSSGEVRGGWFEPPPTEQIDGGQYGYRVYELLWAPPDSSQYEPFAQILVPAFDGGGYSAKNEYWYVDTRNTSSVREAATGSTVKVKLAAEATWDVTFTPPSGYSAATTPRDVPWVANPIGTVAYRSGEMGMRFFWDGENPDMISKIDWYNEVQGHFHFNRESIVGSHLVLTVGGAHSFPWGWTSALHPPSS